MLAWRLSDEEAPPPPEGIVAGSAEDSDIRDPAERAKVRTTIFLGCTSNLISAGTRESIRYLLQHKLVSCLVTTAGGVEEDLMKCLAPHYLGSQRGVEGFALKGAELRQKGINRIGNLLVPNRNYCLFEDWWVVVDAGHVHPCLPTPLGENRTRLYSIAFTLWALHAWPLHWRARWYALQFTTLCALHFTTLSHHPDLVHTRRQVHASARHADGRAGGERRRHLAEPHDLANGREDRRPLLHLLLGEPQPHPDLLPGDHRRLHRRHALLPLIQAAGPRRRPRARHPRDQLDGG